MCFLFCVEFSFLFFRDLPPYQQWVKLQQIKKKTICQNTSKSLLPDKSWGALKYNLHPYFLAGDALACDCRKCQGNPFTSLKVWLGMIASNSHLRSDVIVSVLQRSWCLVANFREWSIALFRKSSHSPFPTFPYVSHNSPEKIQPGQGDDLPILAADKGEDCRNWSTFVVTIWCWGLGRKDGVCLAKKNRELTHEKLRGSYTYKRHIYILYIYIYVCVYIYMYVYVYIYILCIYIYINQKLVQRSVQWVSFVGKVPTENPWFLQWTSPKWRFQPADSPLMAA